MTCRGKGAPVAGCGCSFCTGTRPVPPPTPPPPPKLAAPTGDFLEAEDRRG